jgi:hypothetical protein
MKKIGIKKYFPGVGSLVGSSFTSAFSGGNSGMVNPGNANLIKMAPNQNSGMPLVAPSIADSNTKSITDTKSLTDTKLPASSTIKTPAKGPSFSDKAGAAMGSYGGAITSVAGSLMPLLMKKPKPDDKPYKKGTKLIKYQSGTDTLKGKNGAPDTLYNKTTGSKQPFLPADIEEEEKPKQKTIKKVEKAKPAETTKSTENKGLYQGNKTAEGLVTGGLPAVAEIIKSNPTSKLGKTTKSLIKYGPAAVRFVYDAIADKKNKGKVDWTARGGRFLQDVTVGTAATGAVKTARGAKKSYKEQESAAAKETENPVAPSRKEALKVGATQAAEKSTVNQIIKYAKDAVGNSPQGKQAKINIKNADARKEVKNKKYTGEGNNEKGVAGEYYIKGKVVDEKTYKTTTAKRKEEAEKLKKARQKSKEGPSDYEKELEQADPEFRNRNYVTQKQKDFEKEYLAKREAEGAKDYSKDVKTFREEYTKKQNTINTQNKPANMSDEDFTKKKASELAELKKTKTAFDKAMEAKKPTSKTTTKETTTKPKESSNKPVTKTETTGRVKRQPVGGSSKNQDVDTKREPTSNKGKAGAKPVKSAAGNKPAAGSSKKSNSPTGERKEFSGRMPPGMIPGMPAGAKKKANGARLIKYK